MPFSFLDKVLGREQPASEKRPSGLVGGPALPLAGIVGAQAKPADEWTATSARPQQQLRPAGYLGPAAPAGQAYMVPEAPAGQQAAHAPAVPLLNAAPAEQPSNTSKRSSGPLVFSLEAIMRFARRTTDASARGTDTPHGGGQPGRGTEERTKESPRRSWHGGIFSSMSSPRATPPPT